MVDFGGLLYIVYTVCVRKLMRNAFIGFTASMVSDTISNSLRVVKTTRQTYGETIRYPGACENFKAHHI